MIRRIIDSLINRYYCSKYSLPRIILSLKKRLWTAHLRGHAIKYQEPIYVGGPCVFGGRLYLGKNCNFNGITFAGSGTVHIGDNFHSGVECMMITQNHDYDDGDAVPYGDKYHLKTIIIEDNVWLGNRVTLIGDLRIGEGAIVAAGSVVAKDIPPFAIAGGNPAKVIKYRNIERYKRLKSEGKFH